MRTRSRDVLDLPWLFHLLVLRRGIVACEESPSHRCVHRARDDIARGIYVSEQMQRASCLLSQTLLMQP